MPLRWWFRKSAPPLHKAAFYPLAGQVCAGRLALEEALRRADTPRILAGINVTVIDQYNEEICELSLREPCQALVLAKINRMFAEQQGDGIARANCESTLGWLYRDQNQFEQALAHYREALWRFEQEGTDGRPFVAGIQRDIGDVFERQGQLDDARRAFENMQQIAIELQRPDLESMALNRLGKLCLFEGNTMAALEDFTRALELSRACGFAGGEETALGNRGLAYHLLGRLADAEHDHQEALGISRQIHEQNLRDAVSITQRIVSQDQIGRHLGDLGSVLLARGRLDDAERRLIQAIEIAGRTNDRPGEQQRQDSLGNVYQARAQLLRDQSGQRDRWLLKAIEHHQRAVEIARECKDAHSLGALLLNLGNDYSEWKRFDKALEYYGEACKLAQQCSDKDTLWRIDYVLGNLWAAQDHYEQAHTYYASAIKQVETQRSQIAIELRMNYWHDRVALYKRAALCEFELERPDRLWLALEYTEQSKARYLADRLGQPAGEAGDIQAAIDDLAPDTAVVVFNVAEEETLVFVIANPPAECTQIEIGKDWQRSACGRIWARRFATFNRRMLQRILIETNAADEAIGGYLVEYYREQQANRQAQDDERELAPEERCWSKPQGPLQATIDHISASLLAELDRALARLKIKQVIFMPNLGLALLPLHACARSGDSPGYFLDQYVVRYMPSFRLLRYCQQLAGKQPSAGGNFCAAVYSGAGLEWTKIEIALIGDLFEGAANLVLGGDTGNPATPQAVFSAAPGYTFVHFACHGTFDLVDQLRSHLKMDPGRPDSSDQAASFEPLTLAMILERLKLPGTRLVVLGACESGMADPGNLADEYFSLPAGFLLAGAPAVVASLWIANDLASALLLHYFYDQHITQRLPPAQALCCAQVWLRDLTLDAWGQHNASIKSRNPFEYIDLERARYQLLQEHGNTEDALQIRPFANPFYWAAFTVIGA